MEIDIEHSHDEAIQPIDNLFPFKKQFLYAYCGRKYFHPTVAYTGAHTPQLGAV